MRFFKMQRRFPFYFFKVTLRIVFVLYLLPDKVVAQDYEVADIDCAVGTGGKELLTAKLRKPDGFRGVPIFADDRGNNLKDSVSQDLLKDTPCQIFPHPTDVSGRVFTLRVTDFSQCGVLKRNGFIHVRVWFPQLPGVVMLSDQEVIIMCKPPQPTVTQSKAAGFAGSIPSGARVSGIVEESPGRLEYEVALFRETGSPSSAGRSSPGAGAYITGADAHELPVDQAVPIGTRLQLRARINADSAWQHAKLMEVSVSPDPKDASAEGSVALIKEGCRNPDLASIIPKQPYRYKDRTNEVVLDFEAFLLSNMGERNTLWLHTQIKACMESQDCHPEFCMDVYQPSGYGKRKKRHTNDIGPTTQMTMSIHSTNSSVEYSAPLAQHWKAYQGGQAYNLNETNIAGLELSSHHIYPLPDPPPSDFGKTSHSTLESVTSHNNLESVNENAELLAKLDEHLQQLNSGSEKIKEKDGASTNFGDNIGFSVIMPAEYYRTSEILSRPYECRGWATATMCALMGALVAGAMSCVMSYRLKKYSSYKEKSLYHIHSSSGQTPIPIRTNESAVTVEHSKGASKVSSHHHHHHHSKYARDPSIYRP